MGRFTTDEVKFLDGTDRPLARMATVGSDGSLHVAPVGYRYDPTAEVIEIRGHNLTRTKKWKDLARDARVAIVVDDVLPPWRPRGVEVRGSARLVEGIEPVIVVEPRRIVSWGLGDMDFAQRNARDVGEPS